MNTNVILPPSALAEAPSESVTARYSFIPTTRVINVLQNEGWSIVKAASKRPRTQSIEHTQHLIEFEHADLKAVSGDTNLRILLKNSHNGMSSFQFLLGLYRIVCSNGLVVSKGTAQNFSIRHVGFTELKVLAALNAMTKQAPVISEYIARMQSTTLVNLNAFGTQVATEFGIEPSAYNINKLVEYNGRTADNDSSVWTAYNRVQERIVKGKAYVYQSDINKRQFRKLRAIKSIDRQISVNQKLWDIAVSYTR